MPRVGYLAVAVLIIGTALVSLVHHPSTAERAADLRAFTSDMQVNNQGYGVGSSAGAETCTTANGNTNCRTDVYICQLQ